MAKDNQIVEINNFIKRTKIPFSGGLSHSDNDSVVGMAQDIQNMEIEYGVATRRRGSMVLNGNCDVPQDYFLFETITVGGSEFIIAVNEYRYLVAFFKDFPQQEMFVFRNHFDRSKAVTFNRGVRFFLISTPFGWTIVNEFGDAYAIKSDGVLRVSKLTRTDGVVDIKEYLPLDELNRAYDIEYALYLDIFNATNKRLDNFYLATDYKEDTIPVHGEVRVGYVNEVGVVSKLSPSINIEEKSCKVFGVEPLEMYEVTEAEAFNKRKTHPVYGCVYEDELWSGVSDNQSIIEFEEKKTLSTTYNPSFDATQYSVNNANTPVTSSTIRCVALTSTTEDGLISPEIQLVPINTASITTEQAKMIATVNSITPIVHGRYKAKLVGKILDSIAPAGGVGTAFEYDADTYDAADKETDLILYLTNTNLNNLGANSLTWQLNPDYLMLGTSANTWTPSITAGTSNKWFSVFGVTRYTSDRTVVINRRENETEFVFSLKYGDVVDIYFNTDDDTLIKAFPIVDEFFSHGEDFSKMLEHEGFDCWTISNNVTEATSVYKNVEYDIDDFDRANLFQRDMWSDVNNNASIFMDIPTVDNQIAVWHDGYIISKSQRVFVDTADGNSIVYGIDDEQTSKDLGDSVTGRNVSQLPTTKFVAEKFLSFTKPVYQTLRRRAYKYNSFTELLTDVDDIASNGSALCAIRSNRLWIGSSLTLLLDRQIPVNGRLFAVEALGNTFVVFSSEGVFVFDTDGKKKPVHNNTKTSPTVIKATQGVSGVYGIDIEGRVIVVSLRELQTNVYMYVVDVLSEAIHSVRFSEDSVMLEANNVLYIADTDTIYEYSNGAWIGKMKFDNKFIKRMTTLDDKLVVFFYDYPSSNAVDISKDSEDIGE